VTLRVDLSFPRSLCDLPLVAVFVKNCPLSCIFGSVAVFSLPRDLSRLPFCPFFSIPFSFLSKSTVPTLIPAESCLVLREVLRSPLLIIFRVLSVYWQDSRRDLPVVMFVWRPRSLRRGLLPSDTLPSLRAARRARRAIDSFLWSCLVPFYATFCSPAEPDSTRFWFLPSFYLCVSPHPSLLSRRLSDFQCVRPVLRASRFFHTRETIKAPFVRERSWCPLRVFALELSPRRLAHSPRLHPMKLSFPFLRELLLMTRISE